MHSFSITQQHFPCWINYQRTLLFNLQPTFAFYLKSDNYLKTLVFYGFLFLSTVVCSDGHWYGISIRYQFVLVLLKKHCNCVNVHFFSRESRQLLADRSPLGQVWIFWEPKPTQLIWMQWEAHPPWCHKKNKRIWRYTLIISISISYKIINISAHS